MKRIHVPNMGPDKGKISLAIEIGVNECKQSDCVELTIITPLKESLDSTIVGEVLGKDAANNLRKGRKVLIGKQGVSLRHESVSTVLKGKPSKVGLVFDASQKEMQKLDDLDFDCLIYVPWLDKDGEDWAQKWNAQTYGGTTQGTGVNLHTEVLGTIETITRCVNLSTGLSHPSDKKFAKDSFKLLQSKGILWDPTEIEKWAVRNGWSTKHANDMANLSQKYT